MEIEVSVGEIVDKLSILHIKSEKIDDVEKLKNVNKEYHYLHEIVFALLNINYDDHYQRILDVNKELWDIEDRIRDKERNKEFDDEFIELARSVYITNDKRSEIKKEINQKYSSNFVEEKSYKPY
jgi:hypothetical protein